MIYRYDALIFDMDGTLLDSMRAWRTMWREYIAENNLPMPETLKNETLYSCGGASRLIAQEAGLNAEDVVNDMIDKNLRRHYLTDVEPKPLVIETLGLMRDAGYRMALATATPLRYALEALQRHDMLRFFPDRFDTQVVAHNKSQAGFFEGVAERLGVPPERCLMFEDALYAMRGARAANMNILAIEDEISAKDRPEIRAIADIYCETWRDVQAALHLQG